MKLIIAYIRPERLDEVKRELFKREIYALSVMNILGAGRQKGFRVEYRGALSEVNLLSKIRLEIGVNDDFEDKAIEAIVAGARTDAEGDGIILVQDVARSIRIRTGDKDVAAIR